MKKMIRIIIILTGIIGAFLAAALGYIYLKDICKRIKKSNTKISGLIRW